MTLTSRGGAGGKSLGLGMPRCVRDLLPQGSAGGWVPPVPRTASSGPLALGSDAVHFLASVAKDDVGLRVQAHELAHQHPPVIQVHLGAGMEGEPAGLLEAPGRAHMQRWQCKR